MLAGIAAAAGRPVSEQLAGFRRYPQLLVNVEVRAKPALADELATAQRTEFGAWGPTFR